MNNKGYDYWRGFREGVLAERRRAVLIAAQMRTKAGHPHVMGHLLAHRIAEAGEELPSSLDSPVEWAQHEYTAFGERRYEWTVPSVLESRTEPYTGKKNRLHRLIEQNNHLKHELRQSLESQQLLKGLLAKTRAVLNKYKQIIDSR